VFSSQEAVNHKASIKNATMIQDWCQDVKKRTCTRYRHTIETLLQGWGWTPSANQGTPAKTSGDAHFTPYVRNNSKIAVMMVHGEARG
jgi:hypothetical protein